MAEAFVGFTCTLMRFGDIGVSGVGGVTCEALVIGDVDVELTKEAVAVGDVMIRALCIWFED